MSKEIVMRLVNSLALLSLFAFSACSSLNGGDANLAQNALSVEKQISMSNAPTHAVVTKKVLVSHQIGPRTEVSYVNPQGMTIETRFPAPKGFVRSNQNSGYAQYLRSLPLLPDGSPVLLFNGEEKGYQNGHVAVIDMDVGNRDLQQCADAAMRLRTEYYFKTGQHEKMVYHLTNRQELSWPKWKSGYRLKYLGHNKTEYKKTSSPDGSYSNYRRWLDALMMYAGVASMMKESKKLNYDEFEPGDVVASKGHMIIILDKVESQEDVLFLLGQSYMPAQQIEILKNPYASDGSPWYSLNAMRQAYERGESFITPEWEFPAPGPNLYRMP